MGSPLIALGLFGVFYFGGILPRLRKTWAAPSPRDRFIFAFSTTAFAIFALTVYFLTLTFWLR